MATSWVMPRLVGVDDSACGFIKKLRSFLSTAFNRGSEARITRFRPSAKGCAATPVNEHAQMHETPYKPPAWRRTRRLNTSQRAIGAVSGKLKVDGLRLGSVVRSHFMTAAMRNTDSGPARGDPSDTSTLYC